MSSTKSAHKKVSTKPRSNILTIPHANLRLSSKKIVQLDKKIHKILDELKSTLISSGGVGLAAPQIDQQVQVFATYLPHVGEKQTSGQDPVRFFINPQITKTASKKVFSKEQDGTYTLEGCLSLPRLYAPIPRYDWVELEFQEIDPQTKQLTPSHREKFTGFYARNIQHEYDHLQGVLFTDYLIDTNIILYQENPDTQKLEEIEDLSFIEAY